jgi:2-oxoisovalerate dehydrogenase E1 component
VSRERIEEAFEREVAALPEAPRRADPSAPLRPGTRLDGRTALALFDAQVSSRHLDLAARAMRGRDQGFYTIGSSGHEGNAAVAAALRPTDPALLHYRSGAFYVARASQVAGQDPILDVLLGVAASREEPISGGRHKVFGKAELWIPPQTSTIASHLPRAVGMAFAHERKKQLHLPADLPPDAIILCSFGDASVNHSTALGAINAACRAATQRLPVPVLFVCEDNGLGISVRTPPGSIAEQFAARPGLRYLAGDGLDLPAAFDAAVQAAEHVRRTRQPAFLHLSCVRLLGHAGSDAEIAYRTGEEIRADEARDPVLATARLLVAAGLLSPAEAVARYRELGVRVARAAEDAGARPRLSSAAEVMAPLAPRRPDAVAAEAARVADPAARARLFEGRLPEDEPPGPLAFHLNRALADLLALHPELLVFGEDVAKKGGVYGVTRGLWRRAGLARVFDTLLDETTILGLALGGGQLGLLPIPEIQYLAYLHNAEDQLRGEAATLSFFSQGRYRNPMVIRIAAYGYQKGFGGHFHNDNGVAVLRDVPGIVVASPSRGDDAAAMLRTCVAAGKVDGTVCVFLEPIALYHTADLYEPGDAGLALPYDPAPAHVPIGRARTHGDGRDLTLVSFANGLRMSLRAARRLEAKHGVRCRVVDLRWLAPLPIDDVLGEAQATGRVLVVDETRRSGGVSEGVLAGLVDRGYAGKLARVASQDSFVPLGPAAELVLLDEETIERAALALVR